MVKSYPVKNHVFKWVVGLVIFWNMQIFLQYLWMLVETNT